MADIFISHTSSTENDRRWAFWIGRTLTALGHVVHLDAWELNVGDNIPAWVFDRHDAADHILLVLSKAYLQRPYPLFEWTSALHASINGRRRFVLPVRIEPIELPTSLASLRSCDLFGVGESDAYALLEAMFRPAGPPPAHETVFPGQQDADVPRNPFPGARLRAISNIKVDVPYHFLGRDPDLKRIEKAMIRRQGSASIVVLHGLRGVGKTTLAAAYAEARQLDYSVTWWINADDVVSMRADLVALGLRLGWVSPGEDADAAFARVRDRLADADERTLLVYDNAGAWNDLKPFVQRKGSAHVLVTSNARDWSEITRPLQIKVWSPDIGAKYLLARNGRAEDRTPAERLAARALADEFGGLPLAHVQAAAFDAATSCGYVHYLEEFRKRPEIVIEAETSVEYYNGRTIAKTFGMAIDAAAERHPASGVLIAYAALLAPDPIPLTLFSAARQAFGAPLASLHEPELDQAIAALLAFALIDRTRVPDERDPAVVTDCIRLHRLVRLVSASRWSEPCGGLPSRDTALDQLVVAFGLVYPKDVRRSPQVWRLFPHIVEVLRTLVKENSAASARAILDELTRLVVMALRVSEDKKRAGKLIPEYLVTVLGDFYEIEPLKQPIRLLIENHREIWPRLQEQFLATNNLVLRYATAGALASVHLDDASIVTAAQLTALVKHRGLNEFEVGGYALAQVYAYAPERIDPAVLAAWAGRTEYTGRAILGHLLINLALRRPVVFDQHEPAGSAGLWQPVWDFHQIDIDTIEAIGLFRAVPRCPPSSTASNAVRADFDDLVAVEAAIADFLAAARSVPIVRIMADYWELGRNVDLIAEAEDALAGLTIADLGELMRLLFSHPVWLVGETAASTLARLIEAESRLLEVVEALLDIPAWRVRYGASEAAFILSEKHPGPFLRAVRRFYSDPNCRLRGLCAENLGSFILKADAAARVALLSDFKPAYDAWLGDEDCYVLEHVFHFIGTLHRRGLDVAALLPAQLSRLLAGAGQWYSWDRSRFLCHLEARKAVLRAADGRSAGDPCVKGRGQGA
ncbi:TIR domain-containing protein [Bradyrhizobium ontarionense]|uniref:TIR domain-containing protein n=1 Tax=Bradyrhizobium ontarionense TaxID=2898149 RepID=A0ABY3R6Q7_9BRAD|nr:toll/interleukin-1 receptor domain-containing protein [Bradyrhizobium sp. A19]UFZ02976.1 TIR domain-containing protein [Bradyrhizobium sp. A19]